jgi:hypothetical protein
MNAAWKYQAVTATRQQHRQEIMSHHGVKAGNILLGAGSADLDVVGTACWAARRC